MFRQRNLLLTLGALTLMLAAAFAIWSYSAVARTRDWVSVQGRVIESGSETVRVTSRFGDGWAEEPKIRYAYDVGGKTLTGNAIYPGGPWHYDKQDQLQAFLRPYRPGAPVIVHYDPDNPGHAVLLAEGNYVAAWILAATGLFLSVFGWAVRAAPESAPKVRRSQR